MKLPTYAYIPGVNERPDLEEPIAQPIDPKCPEQNECFRYGLELFRNEFYWESHVYLEALWKAHHKVGDIAQFLKALIGIAAAGVNFKQGRIEQAKDQLKRASLILNEIKDANLIGFDLLQLRNRLEENPGADNLSRLF